jgi:hypothetical protein
MLPTMRDYAPNMRNKAPESLLLRMIRVLKDPVLKLMLQLEILISAETFEEI